MISQQRHGFVCSTGQSSFDFSSIGEDKEPYGFSMIDSTKEINTIY